MAFSESDSSEPSPTQQLAEYYPRVGIVDVSVDKDGTIIISYKGDLSNADRTSISDALSSEDQDEWLSRIQFVQSTWTVIETARRMVSGMIA